MDSRSDAAYECIDSVMNLEKPDFVILTGDIIYSSPAVSNFKKIINHVSRYGVPFAFVFGNHDHQFDATDRELLESVKDVPYNMTAAVPGISGDCNFDIPVYSCDGKKKEMILYAFDSHDESQQKNTEVKGYDAINRDQIDWYVHASKRYAKANGGRPLPSLAFFHIPFPEYKEASADKKSQSYGNHRESVCCPRMNSGLFYAMKERGDVMGVFCGHDHDNDFAVDWYGILLAYGRFSGGNTEYNHLGVNGARVIEVRQGERTMHTWIRLRNGDKLQDTIFPRDYVK